MTYFNVSSSFTLIFSSNPLVNLFFKCCDEPRHLHSPFTSTVILVHSASHSSMLCEVNTIDLPASRDCMTTFHKLRFVAGSMPVVGSSKKITLKLPIIARLALSFLLLPPLIIQNLYWQIQTQIVRTNEQQIMKYSPELFHFLVNVLNKI